MQACCVPLLVIKTKDLPLHLLWSSANIFPQVCTSSLLIYGLSFMYNKKQWPSSFQNFASNTKIVWQGFTVACIFSLDIILVNELLRVMENNIYRLLILLGFFPFQSYGL